MNDAWNSAGEPSRDATPQEVNVAFEKVLDSHGEAFRQLAEMDSSPQNPNIHYRESLTVWGEAMSAQMRGLAILALHHYDGAPRSTEDGHPFLLSTLDAVLLRDLLNAATARGQLPKPAESGGAAEDAMAIGSRPAFVDQVSRAYQAGRHDAQVEAQARAANDVYRLAPPAEEHGENSREQP